MKSFVFTIALLLLTQSLYATATKALSPYISVSGNSGDSDKNRYFKSIGDIAPQKDWTIIVYMSGDNNLESFAIKDINEMESSLGDNINISILVDRAKGFNESNGNWSDARVYQIKRDSNPQNINSKLLLKLGEVNMGDRELLREFISYSIKKFPAKHYALIMWNHGAGWAFNSSDIDTASSSKEEGFLRASDISYAVKNSLKKEGLKRLDIIGFDMCLMSQLEVANELKGIAKVMIASEATEPADGWPYSMILPEFTKSTKGVRAVANSIVDKYNIFYSKRGDTIYTLSAMDLRLLDKTLNSFNSLLDALSKLIESKWSQFSKSLFFSETYQSRVEDIKRGKDAIASIDMMDALLNLVTISNSQDIKDSYTSLVENMDSFILSSATSLSKDRSNGVSIYAPTMSKNYNPNYSSLTFAKDAKWDKFLKSIYQAQQKNSTDAKILDIEPFNFKLKKRVSELEPINTNGFKYEVDGKGILWIKGMYGLSTKDGGLEVLKSGTVLNVGGALKEELKGGKSDKMQIFIPKYKDGLNRGNLYFDGLLYLVVGGDKFHYGTVYTPLDSKSFIVPIVYKSKKLGTYEGVIYYNSKSWVWEAVEIFNYQKDGRVSSQRVNPAPEDEITLRILYISKDGEQKYRVGNSFKWGDGSQLALSYFEQKSYSLGLNVKSLNGTSKTKFLKFRVKANELLEQSVKAIRKKPLTRSDFIGDWVFIDPDKFLNGGKIVELDKRARFIKDDENENFLLCGESKKGSKKFDNVYKVLMDFRLFPHLRYFKVKDDGDKRDSIDDFKVVFTMLYRFPNYNILLQLDTLTYDLSMAIRLNKEQNQKSTPQATTTGSTTDQNHPNSTQNSSSTPTAPKNSNQLIVGRWQSSDGEYFTLSSDGEYSIRQDGKLISEGNYRVLGDSLTLYTDTQRVFQFDLSISPNRLVLSTESGDRYIYTRVRESNQNSNSYQRDYISALNGVWRMPQVALLVITGDRYRLYEGNMLSDKGRFEADRSTIVAKSDLTGEVYRYRYTLTQDRLQMTDPQGNSYIYFKDR